MASSDRIELTILMPCLNEAETIERCVRSARQFLESRAIRGEVLVADNGSTDGSTALATAAGARVVSVLRKGYGSALAAGIASAQGRFVIMGDADDSYDFSSLDGFVRALRDGSQLVMGNRFAGGIAPGAMPMLHRYLGNPVLSFIGRLLFRSPIRDFHCGLRGFRREAILGLALKSSGMEYASEMVVKATLAGLAISEVGTTLRPDGRNRPPHLRTWRDGWRHLRFLLLMSPRWLLLYPGICLLLVGAIASQALLRGPVWIGGVGLDIHSLLFSSSMMVLGTQLIIFSILSRAIAVSKGILPAVSASSQSLRLFTIERGVLTGVGLGLIGLLLAARTLLTWGDAGFSALDVTSTMRHVIPSVTLMLIGAELTFAAFVLGMIHDPSAEAGGR